MSCSLRKHQQGQGSTVQEILKLTRKGPGVGWRHGDRLRELHTQQWHSLIEPWLLSPTKDNGDIHAIHKDDTELTLPSPHHIEDATF